MTGTTNQWFRSEVLPWLASGHPDPHRPDDRDFDVGGVEGASEHIAAMPRQTLGSTTSLKTLRIAEH